MSRSRKTLSIRYALPLLLVGPILATVALIVGFAINNGRRAAQEFGLTVSARTLASIEQHVMSYLEKPSLLNRSHAATGSRFLDLEDADRLADFFWEQAALSSDADLDSLSFGSTTGDFVLVQRFPDGTGELRIRTQETAPNREFYRLNEAGQRLSRTRVQEFDPRTRPWYQAGVQAGEPVWSEIFQAADAPTLNISSIVPIYQGNQLQGVLAATIQLQAMNEFLAGLTISPNGEAFILETSGELVASSTREPVVIEEDSGERRRLLAVDSSNPQIAATAVRLRERFPDLQALEGTVSFTYNDRGDRQVISVVPLNPEFGLTWLVVVMVPERDFSGAIEANMRATLIIGVVIAIAAVILGLLAARWLVRPIEQLRLAARDIQADRFEPYTLQEVASRHDELGELGQAFQDMGVVIGDRQQSFNAQVRELRQQKSTADNVSLQGVELAYYQALQSKAQWLRAQEADTPRNGGSSE